MTTNVLEQLPELLPPLTEKLLRTAPKNYWLLLPYMPWNRRTTITYLIKPATRALTTWGTPTDALRAAREDGAEGIRWVTGTNKRAYIDMIYANKLTGDIDAEDEAGDES